MANDLVVLENQLKPLAPRFTEVLPPGLPVERLMRTVVLSCERLPKLLECDRQSLFNSAMSAAVLGLEVDGVTGQAFLIPFAGKAQLVIGYKGMNTLGARSGITITGSVVREGDDFDFDKGEGWVKHKPQLGKPGRIIAAWSKAAAHGRPPVVEVMGIDELMAVKAKSPGAKRNDSPWNDPNIGFPAMCEKTVKRRLSRSLPLNTMQLAARLDEIVEEQGTPAHIRADGNIIIDADFAEASPTPTADQLTTPSTSRPPRQVEATSPAPSAPSSTRDRDEAQGGADTPTWEDYVDRWAFMLTEATDAKALHTLWSSDVHKNMRREINWPEIGSVNPDPLKDLTDRVTAKIAALKGPT